MNAADEAADATAEEQRLALEVAVYLLSTDETVAAMSAEWIAFADHMPDSDPALKRHGLILVTNNIEARDRYRKKTHVWLTTMVHSGAGEITCFAEPTDIRIRNLTHWRPAIAEEWPDHYYSRAREIE